MASYADQLVAAKTASQAANAIETQMRSAIQKAFDDWDSGTLTNQTVRYQLERIVRTAFRSAASIAAGQVARQSGLPGWKPKEQVFNPDTLKMLLADTRRNLAAYKATHDEVARKKAINNISHAAGVGVHAGFTAQQIASYSELQADGMQVQKFWSANFDGHVPCVWCQQLHGTSVALNQTFDNPNPKAKSYLSLIGPPLHPNCQCFLVTFITSLDNAGEEPSLDPALGEPAVMDTTMVKKMKPKIFHAVLAAHKKISLLVKGSKK